MKWYDACWKTLKRSIFTGEGGKGKIGGFTEALCFGRAENAVRKRFWSWFSSFYFIEAFLLILLLSCVCQCVCTRLCWWCLLRPQGVRSLGARVTNVSELPDLGAGIRTLGLTIEQQVHLTAELSVGSHIAPFYVDSGEYFFMWLVLSPLSHLLALTSSPKIVQYLLRKISWLFGGGGGECRISLWS